MPATLDFTKQTDRHQALRLRPRSTRAIVERPKGCRNIAPTYHGRARQKSITEHYSFAHLPANKGLILAWIHRSSSSRSSSIHRAQPWRGHIRNRQQVANKWIPLRTAD